MINPRQKQILELVERRGYVSIDSLAALFDTTPQTVRRDINSLCDQGLFLRQHGGASLPLMNTSYRQRNIEFATEKTGIAESVVGHLPNRASIFLPLGTTVEAVARVLAKTDKQLTIVTNSVEVARIFWIDTTFETVVTGGVLQQRNGGLIGQQRSIRAQIIVATTSSRGLELLSRMARCLILRGGDRRGEGDARQRSAALRRR
jgi:DeoR family transcriptional regulator, glycerol-3-phosphate regulon repressor